MVAFCLFIKKEMFVFKSSTYKKLFYTYICCIIILLIIPLNGTINLTHVYFGFRSDHIVHSLIFLPFMFLCFLSQVVETSINLLIIGFLFAAFCETLHVFIPYRNASIFDFYANCIGITSSFVLFKLAQRMKIVPTLDS